MMKTTFGVLLLLCVLVTSGNTAAAKTHSCIKGNFEYKYKVQKTGVWITKIIPLSSKGISVLTIPKKLEGKKVVKLGGTGDKFYESEINTKEYSNIFGVDKSEEDDGSYVPADVQSKVKKIKKIHLPSTMKEITMGCFTYVQDGKILNIPKGVVKNLDREYGGSITKVKWKNLTISSQNKKYKSTNGCLLSKDGKTLFGFLQRKQKIIIPDGVKRISNRGDYNGAATVIIPKSVAKIEDNAFSTQKAIEVKISKRNKRYAVKNGSIYSKKSGRLVSGCITKGVLQVPKGVTLIRNPGYLGKIENLRKVIVPVSVKKICYVIDDRKSEKISYVFKSETPPVLYQDSPYPSPYELFRGSTVYVPVNCKEKYIRQWKIPHDMKITMIEQG